MSIELFDSKGGLGQAATNTGFGDARRASDKNGGPALKDFFDKGVTKNPKLVSAQAKLLAHKVEDAQVRNTLMNLSKLMMKAKDYVGVQT